MKNEKGECRRLYQEAVVKGDRAIGQYLDRDVGSRESIYEKKNGRDVKGKEGAEKSRLISATIVI